jgi:hypothetical protein
MIEFIKNNKELLLAIIALVQTLALNYFGVPQDIWTAINLILLTLIGAFTVDRVGMRIVAEMRAARKELKK